MEIKKFDIEGPLLITPKVFKDDRGFFVERFNKKTFESAGLPFKFVQDNYSKSAPKVLRGMHYQTNPSQGKLVSCVHGKIFDVAVDIRKNSPTFGKYIHVELSGENPQHLWIPAGFAHGFCVLGTESADVLYKVDSYYSPAGEICILWNDPELDIQWPIGSPLLSPKDQKGMLLKAI